MHFEEDLVKKPSKAVLALTCSKKEKSKCGLLLLKEYCQADLCVTENHLLPKPTIQST